LHFYVLSSGSSCRSGARGTYPLEFFIMASKSVSLDESLARALQRFAASQCCCWVMMKLSNDALQLAAESSGDFDGFRCAVQAQDSAPAFSVLKVNLPEAKGGLAVDALGRQKTVFFTHLPATAPAFERASTTEAKSAVRAALGVVAHVEFTVESASDIDEASVLSRVKQSTGGTAALLRFFPSEPCYSAAFYDSGAAGQDQVHSTLLCCYSLFIPRCSVIVISLFHAALFLYSLYSTLLSFAHVVNSRRRQPNPSAQPLQRSTPSPQNRAGVLANCCEIPSLAALSLSLCNASLPPHISSSAK
jgi:hypothetical protein